MRKRLTFCASITLAIVLGFGPLLTLAAPVGERGNDSSRVAVRAFAPNGEASKPAKPPFNSKFLSKRPLQNEGAVPGQTTTLLPDGRVLKIGGLEDDGPVSAALIDGSHIHLQFARAWHTATMLPDGKILIAGGMGADGQPVDTAEILDPETQSSELLTSALQSSTINPRSSITPRVYHTATLLTEGLVLISGGVSGKGDTLRTAQLWDFRNRVATTLRSKLKTARYNHAAALLGNGKVTLSGGTDKGGANIENDELYDPQTERFTKAKPGADNDSQLSIPTPRLEASLPEDGATNVPPDADEDKNPVTQLGITAIPVDRPPFPLPAGVYVPIYFTIQPGSAYVKTLTAGGPKGARIIYPNYRDQNPGTRHNFWHYDPEEKGWFVYGQGTVTEDGKQVVPDPGVAVYKFTGAMISPFGNPPADWPPPGSCSVDGDPVDLSTGLFVLNNTDLILPDMLPLALTRTYRPKDTASRTFGIGSTHPYEMLLWSVTNYTAADLVLPDGGRIHYVRISPGNGNIDAEYEHTATPTAFYKSRLKWNGTGWDLTLKDGSVYVFGDTTPLQSIRDRYGNKILITRTSGQSGNMSGNITRITSPNGRWMEFSYDGSNRITQARDNIGRAVNYTYDASGRLWKVTNPLGGVTEYTYDSSHRMLTLKDARGIVYLTNQYDNNGRVALQTQADGTTYQFGYTLDGNGKITQTDVTDPRGNHRIVTFNSNGYPVTDTKGCSCGTGVTYERQTGTNLITSMTDALNRRTEYTYDSTGNVTSVTPMAGTTEAVTTSFTYESSLNRVASVTDPLNHTTSFAYDSQGNLTTVTDALNHQTTLAYNAAGLPTSATDQLGNTTQFGYDGGDPITLTDPLGQIERRFIDAAGRVLSIKNPLGQTTRLEYDSLNRRTRVTDPLQGVSEFSYDANGNLLSLTDARNNATTYSYDNMDRVYIRTDALLHSESYQYNQNGSLTQHTDRKSQVTNYTFDSLERLSQATYADSSTITYSYDAVSRLTQVTDSISGTISYTYDNLDRLLSETTSQGTVSYTYDSAARRATMSVPGQAVVNYSYDSANRLTQITQGGSTARFAYDNANRRTSLTLPNGVVTQYAYDVASRLTSLLYTKGPVILGNLTYAYDPAGRLISTGGSFARTGLPQSMSTATYNAANQQTTFGAQTLTYDLSGNLTSDGSNTFVWNARNQLGSLNGPGLNATFQYDATGRRSTKTINGAGTAFLYNGASIVQEQVAGVASANLLTGGIDELFTRADSSGSTNVITDIVASSIALTDPSGTVQTSYTYEPFGNTTFSGTANGNSQKYTGREDDGTGLYYYRARYYSPALQRFIGEDPAGIAGGDANLYGYVENSPVMHVDPLGLASQRRFGGGNGWMPPRRPAPSTGGRKDRGAGTGGAGSICVATCADTTGTGAVGALFVLGGVAVYCAMNPPKSIPLTKAEPPPQPPDKPECEEQYRRDTQTCNSLPDPAARRRCHSSAVERYGACRNRNWTPPLITR